MSILFSIMNMFTQKASDREYGLLRYDYNTFSRGYNPKDCNLGDYIQSLTAKQFLPAEAQIALIDRDTLKYYT